MMLYDPIATAVVSQVRWSEITVQGVMSLFFTRGCARVWLLISLGWLARVQQAHVDLVLPARAARSRRPCCCSWQPSLYGHLHKGLGGQRGSQALGTTA